MILTKQDVYKEYFWKELSTISDQDLLTADHEDFIAKAEANEKYVSSFESSKAIEQEDIIEQAEILQEQFKLTNNVFLESLPFDDYYILEQVVNLFSRPHENAKRGIFDVFRSPKISQLTAEELKTVFSIFNKIITKITEWTAYSPDDETDFTMLNKFLWTE